MNKKTRQDVVEIIELRFTQICASFSDILRGELEMAIDLAGLTEAIGLDQQRNYKERLNRIIERNNQQGLESFGRVA
ncbi:hypothetical protein NP554_20740 [Pseudomonas asiatica]|jgi:hypothetical protein|uniref:Uncharacterized protein n=2 Tax=Pseudomonas TaxID=286 RepID=V9V6A0_9PSED|nr:MULTISPECIES: hypothetical protein [Pseudomonas]AHC85714.1 hypothetical protein X969_11170 [Pseudomonas monteilii SB3078]AHC91074.1 hypothetical protein X970_10825 [Pseudomonas monteilii SB3101]MDD2114211.1 hypothetical protein [Pseudomonas asiatica]HDS0974467.1 hypothetical protein [Pseudomonas putida]